MTKAELVERLAKTGGLPKPVAEKVLNAFLDSVEDALCQDGKLALSGLGTFAVEERKARTGRNPRTGEAIAIPAGKVVKFRPAKALKDAVDSSLKG